MEKINFVNNSQPAINATNLNKLQQNVEDVTGDLSDLETSDRDNLVEAINEAKRSGGDAVPIHSIFDYDGDTVPTGYEEVNSYSTSEVKTGDTWIDGKAIYRKVYTQSVSANNDFNISIDNNINIVKLEGFLKTSNMIMPMNYYNQNAQGAANDFMYVLLSSSILTGHVSWSGTVYITLEYTKATD